MSKSKISRKPRPADFNKTREEMTAERKRPPLAAKTNYHPSPSPGGRFERKTTKETTMAKAKKVAEGADADTDGEETTSNRNSLETIGGHKIKVLVEGNPKREGSSAHQRFALYKNGIKVETFINNGGTMGDLRHDVKKGYIELVE